MGVGSPDNEPWTGRSWRNGRGGRHSKCKTYVDNVITGSHIAQECGFARARRCKNTFRSFFVRYSNYENKLKEYIGKTIIAESISCWENMKRNLLRCTFCLVLPLHNYTNFFGVLHIFKFYLLFTTYITEWSRMIYNKYWTYISPFFCFLSLSFLSSLSFCSHSLIRESVRVLSHATSVSH